MKILTIFALHTDTAKKLKTTINNYNILNKYSNTTIFVDSNNYIDLIKKNINTNTNSKNNIFYYYIKNSHLIDIEKWIHGLNKINYTLYDRIILLNDSILIIRDINDFINLFKNNHEIYGISGSNELKFHIHSFLRAFNINGIKKFIKYYNNNRNNFQFNYLPCHYNNATKCYNDLKNILNNTYNFNFNNIKNVCNNIINNDFISINDCRDISLINKKDIEQKCKNYYFNYLIRNAVICTFEVNIIMIYNNYSLLFNKLYNKNMNLDKDICKNMLLNHNYPIIKLKKINKLDDDEKYILDLIKNKL